jgi:hypothetical protein
MAGQIIMSITYGIAVKEYDDPYINAAEEGVRALFAVGIPGAFLVDFIPWLRWVPEWIPGAGFKTKAREWKRHADIMLNNPYEVTRRDMVSRPSLRRLLRNYLKYFEFS